VSGPSRPCLLCGAPIPSGSRCPDCRIARPSKPPTAHPLLRTYRWDQLSKRLRNRSPFCEICDSTDRLSVDHVIPASERPDLIFAIENLRVLCLHHNQSRGNRCTEEERQRVLDALAKRKPSLRQAGTA
jgi:5-methylcytosine-specific restriction endonuclease McrA